MDNLSQYQFVEYEVLGPIARIWQNRPEARNAQGRQMLDELDHAFATADADDNIRVIIFAGRGKHFSAGHDLKEAQRERPNPTAEERWEYEGKRFYQYTLNLLDITKPTIAQVQGACVAGAFMMSSVCDLVVASDDAYFSDPVTQSLGVASLEVLIHPWIMSMRKAKEVLFTGSRIDAKEALEIGMINQVVPRDQLEAATLELAETIAKTPPFALKLLKRSLNRTWDAQGFRVAVSAHFDAHNISHMSKEFQDNLSRGLSTSIPTAKEVGSNAGE
jgi:Enoyl-CoA hydratase/carnithine racemase